VFILGSTVRIHKIHKNLKNWPNYKENKNIFKLKYWDRFGLLYEKREKQNISYITFKRALIFEEIRASTSF
jgi:hypothetical protein